MPTVIKDLLGSKKFLVSFVAVLVWILGRFGFHIDEEALLTVLSPFYAYILAQGVADHGKEAAKINADAAPKAG